MPRRKENGEAPKSKMAAVRLVLAANPDATGVTISEALKKQYGMDLDAKNAGSYKFHILRTQKIRKRRKARRANATAATNHASPESGFDDLLRAAEKLGWQRVKEVVDKVTSAPA